MSAYLGTCKDMLLKRQSYLAEARGRAAQCAEQKEGIRLRRVKPQRCGNGTLSRDEAPMQREGPRQVVEVLSAHRYVKICIQKHLCLVKNQLKWEECLVFGMSEDAANARDDQKAERHDDENNGALSNPFSTF